MLNKDDCCLIFPHLPFFVSFLVASWGTRVNMNLSCVPLSSVHFPDCTPPHRSLKHALSSDSASQNYSSPSIYHPIYLLDNIPFSPAHSAFLFLLFLLSYWKIASELWPFLDCCALNICVVLRMAMFVTLVHRSVLDWNMTTSIGWITITLFIIQYIQLVPPWGWRLRIRG